MNFFGNLAKKYIQKNETKEEPSESNQPKDVDELQKKIDELTKQNLELSKYKEAYSSNYGASEQIVNIVMMMDEDPKRDEALYQSFKAQHDAVKKIGKKPEVSENIKILITSWRQVLCQGGAVYNKIKQYLQTYQKEIVTKTSAFKKIEEKVICEIIEVSILLIKYILDLCDQNEQIQNERNDISSFKDQLKKSSEETKKTMEDKIASMKNENDKLKLELEAAIKYKEKFEQQCEKFNILEVLVNNNKKALSKDADIIASLNNEIKLRKDQFEFQKDDFVNCKLKIDEMQSIITDLKKQIEFHKSENNKLVEKNKKIDELNDKIIFLNKQMSVQNEKLEFSSKYNNEWQLSKKDDESKYLSIIKNKDNTIAELQSSITKLDSSLLEIQESKKLAAVLNQSISELNECVQQEKQKSSNKMLEISELQKCIEDLKASIKKRDEETKNQIDKRMINTFLVNFLNPTISPIARKEIVHSISSIMEFNDDQKKVLGIDEKPVSQQFIEFLLHN